MQLETAEETQWNNVNWEALQGRSFAVNGRLVLTEDEIRQNIYQKGSEHLVLRCRDQILKIVRQYVSFWQKMDFKTAKEDLEFFQKYLIRIVPTMLHQEVQIDCVNGIRKQLAYALGQPFIHPAHEMSIEDLFTDERIRKAFLDMVIKAEKLYENEDRGVDFLGVEAMLIALKTMSPLHQAFHASVRNVLIPEEDIYVHNGGDDSRVKIADLGEPLLCDVRLYNFERGEKFYGRNLAKILRTIHLLQYGALWKLLEEAGEKAEVPYDCAPRKIGAKLAEDAIPQIIK